MFNKILKIFSSESLQKSNSIESLTKSAINGDPESQYKLAICYLHGDQVDKNEGSFERWAISASEQGHMLALYELACFHRMSRGKMRTDLSGENTIDHIELAYKEFETLAKLGLLEAQEILGDMYRFGEGFGIEEDKQKSMYWYSEANKNGSERSLEILEYMKNNE